MTEEEKQKLPQSFRDNFGRFRAGCTEAARNAGAKGHEVQAERRERERVFVEDLKLVLAAKMFPTMENVHEKMELPGDTKDQRMATVIGLVRKAQQGDVAAQKMIWTALGEYIETSNVNINNRSDYSGLVLGDDSFAQ